MCQISSEQMDHHGSCDRFAVAQKQTADGVEPWRKVNVGNWETSLWVRHFAHQSAINKETAKERQQHTIYGGVFSERTVPVIETAAEGNLDRYERTLNTESSCKPVVVGGPRVHWVTWSKRGVGMGRCQRGFLLKHHFATADRRRTA